MRCPYWLTDLVRIFSYLDILFDGNGKKREKRDEIRIRKRQHIPIPVKHLFFLGGVDDENFARLEMSFDRDFSNDMIPLFLSGVSIIAFRECPITGRRRRNEQREWKEEGRER